MDPCGLGLLLQTNHREPPLCPHGCPYSPVTPIEHAEKAHLLGKLDGSYLVHCFCVDKCHPVRHKTWKVVGKGLESSRWSHQERFGAVSLSWCLGASDNAICFLLCLLVYLAIFWILFCPKNRENPRIYDGTNRRSLPSCYQPLFCSQLRAEDFGLR